MKIQGPIPLVLGTVFLVLIYLASNAISRSNSQALPTAWSTLFPLPTVSQDFPTPFPPSRSHYYSGSTYQISDYLITTWDSQILDDARQAVTITSPNQAQITISEWSVSVGRIHHDEFDLQRSAEWFQANISEDINNDNSQEIVITTSQGGNNGNYTIYVYSLGERPSFILNSVYFAYYYFRGRTPTGAVTQAVGGGATSRGSK